jgi:hypothetical protein
MEKYYVVAIDTLYNKKVYLDRFFRWTHKESDATVFNKDMELQWNKAKNILNNMSAGYISGFEHIPDNKVSGETREQPTLEEQVSEAHKRLNVHLTKIQKLEVAIADLNRWRNS